MLAYQKLLTEDFVMMFNDHFHQLAAQAMAGDDQAGAQLRRELEPQMFFMVRHALGGRVQTPLTRTIVAAVRKLDPTVDVLQGCSNEPTIRRLASDLCERFVDGLCRANKSQNPRETVQCAFCTLA